MKEHEAGAQVPWLAKCQAVKEYLFGPQIYGRANFRGGLAPGASSLGLVTWRSFPVGMVGGRGLLVAEAVEVAGGLAGA